VRVRGVFFFFIHNSNSNSSSNKATGGTHEGVIRATYKCLRQIYTDSCRTTKYHHPPHHHPRERERERKEEKEEWSSHHHQEDEQKERERAPHTQYNVSTPFSLLHPTPQIPFFPAKATQPNKKRVNEKQPRMKRKKIYHTHPRRRRRRRRRKRRRTIASSPPPQKGSEKKNPNNKKNVFESRRVRVCAWHFCVWRNVCRVLAYNGWEGPFFLFTAPPHFVQAQSWLVMRVNFCLYMMLPR